MVIQAGRRPSSTASKSSACAWAAARRRSASSRSSRSARSTRWWSSTTTSPACSPSTRPAAASTCRPRASRCAAASRRRGATSRWPTPAPAGAAPTSPTRCRSSRAGTRTSHGPGLRLLMVIDHRRARAVVRARRTAACRSRAPMPAEVRRVVERIGENCEPSLCHGAVPRRRRRQPARRRHREPGAAHARDQARAGQRDLRRRAGLCVAGRRHHRDGRRGAHARQQLRHRADAGDRRADRVQHAAATTTRALGGHMEHRAPARRGAGARRLAQRRRAAGAPLASHGRGAIRWPLGQRAACWADGVAMAAQRTALAGRPLAFHARPDRHRDRGRRRRRCGRRRARSGLAALRHACSTSWLPSCRCCASRVRRRPCRAAAARSRAACGSACAPFARGFITPMAAVAGAVAQELIACYHRPGIERAWINNGGDIALHLAAGAVGARRPVRRPGALSIRAATRGPLATDGQFEMHAEHAGARRRHQRLARPQLLARHRRQRDRAGARRGARPTRRRR